MNLEYLCIGCMEKKGDAEACPLCGWVEGTPPQSHLHISPRVILKEKYLLGRVLGQGGFGITYLAWDIFLERKLAIKEYFPRELVYRESGATTVSVYTGTQSEQYSFGLSKFLAEAKNLARFEGHPNIVSVRDYFEENATAYMVMNYLDGVTLGDFLDQRKHPMNCQEALAVINPVLDALRTVHEAGLLHRDISPDNIMITAKKRVMLLDFGAARHAVGEKGKKFSVIVKPGYAPEEQYRSNGVQGPWTDIYATAATFYRAVTGMMPPESLDRLGEDTIKLPSSLGITLDPVVEAALMKALAVNSPDRYQTIAQFQDALKRRAGVVITEQREENRMVEVAEHAISAADQASVSRKGEPAAGQDRQAFAEKKPELAAEYVINIGRSLDNDIIIEDQMVSRHHARVTRRFGHYYIEDLGSTHGTSVNGKKVESESELPDDSTVDISRVRLFFTNELFLTNEGRVIFNMAQPLSRAKKISPGNIKNMVKFKQLFGLLKKK